MSGIRKLFLIPLTRLSNNDSICLKLKIFRLIDSLERKRLEELYGVLPNFLNEEKDVSDWERLTEEHKQGIFDAIEEIESGKGIPNESEMAKIRKKYSHA